MGISGVFRDLTVGTGRGLGLFKFKVLGIGGFRIWGLRVLQGKQSGRAQFC